MICPECGHETEKRGVPPSMWEPEGWVNWCPVCRWSDL